MTLCVFIKIGSPTIVVRTDELAAGEQAASSSSNTASTGGRWNAALFTRIVEERLLGHPCNRAGRRNGPIRLLMDRDPSHSAKLFQACAKRNTMRIMFLPPKSPDLDPLDYGVFGRVKQLWEQSCFTGRASQRPSWDRACQLLIQMMEAIDPTPHITALPGRIKRCIAAEGGHCER